MSDWKIRIKGKLKELLPNGPNKPIATPCLEWLPELSGFSPYEGLLDNGIIPITIKVQNTGNWPSYSAFIGIYSGPLDKPFYKFKKATSITFTINPGECFKNDIQVDNSLLNLSGPILPGRDRYVLIGVCYDPFFDPPNLVNTNENTIRTNLHVTGGHYGNALLHQPTGKIEFSYSPIQ